MNAYVCNINHPLFHADLLSTPQPPPALPLPQVLSQVWIFSSLVVDSLAIAGQTMVAVELGRGDPAAARAITNR